jgi:Tfp pilus assembly protein PilV
MYVAEESEGGFTVLEVAFASVITMVGLAFVATLFTAAITQNRMVKQHTTTTALAQQKLEEMNAIETSDARLGVGGGLTTGTKQAGYFDTVYVNPDTGIITTNLPQGATPIYDRFWSVEADAQLDRTLLVSVRVVARQPSSGRTAEETTLTTVRSW